jgi:uncharacterized protein RhaS with RHS repeats
MNSVDDPENNATTFLYDSVGSLADPHDATGLRSVTITWDDADRLKSVAGPGDHYAEYSYDTHGKQDSEMDSMASGHDVPIRRSDRLAPCGERQGQAVSYGYDAAGNLTYLEDEG